MGTSNGREFLASDAYPSWRRRVSAAAYSVRIYSPYLDRLVVDLLGNADLDPEYLSVVTDLSPESGTLEYRGQLLALKRLLIRGVEIRSSHRLHAKVLLVDGDSVTVGSQNFTSYARSSRETTVVPSQNKVPSDFLKILELWFDEAEPIDLAFVERLLNDLVEPIAKAKEAIEALVASYEAAESEYRTAKSRKSVSRFERDIARALESSTSGGLRQVASDSPYRAGREVAFASLEWIDTGYQTLMRASTSVDLTRWRSVFSGIIIETVQLERLAFYPALLGPEGRMAFVRVASSRITYVWRGVRWGAPRSMRGHDLNMEASFPDHQADGANLVLTFGWNEPERSGHEVRLRFDGARVLPVAQSRTVGAPENPKLLAAIVESVYEDVKAWEEILEDVFSPAHNPRGFMHEKNAASFFPDHTWLRIDHTKILGQSVLLIQPHE